MSESPSENTGPVLDEARALTDAEAGAARPGVAVVGRRKATIVNFIFQNASAGLAIIRGVFLVPVFLYYVGDELYGAWQAVGNVVGWVLMSESGGSHLVREQVAHFFGQADRNKLATTIGSGLVVMAVLSVVAAGVGLSLTPFVASWVRIQASADASALRWAYGLSVAAISLGIYCGGVRAVQQGFQRHAVVGFIQLGTEVASLTLNVILLVYGWGVVSFGVGALAREVLNLVLLDVLMFATAARLGVQVRVSLARVREMARLTAWTFMNYAGEALTQNCDAFLVSAFLGNKMVNVAMFSKRAWDMLMLFTTRFTFSFQPALAHLHGSGDRRRLQEIVEQLLVTLAVLLAAGAGVAWAFNRAFVGLWVGPGFFANPWYSSLYGVGITLVIANQTISQVILALGNIRGSAMSLLITNAARTALLLALLGLIGIMAIPASTLIAVALIGGPYAVRQWQSTLGLQRRDLLRQAAVLGVAVATAGGVAGLAQLLPVATSWRALTVQAAGVSAVILALVYAVHPTIRSSAKVLGRAVASRLLRGRGTARG